MFRVGQKVQCINSHSWSGFSPLSEGHVYTIKQIVEWTGKEAVHLEEIGSYCGIPYYAYRFRPLTERKTDISFAHEILRKATKQADTDIGASA